MVIEYGNITTPVDPVLVGSSDEQLVADIWIALREIADDVAESEDGGVLEGPPQLVKYNNFHNMHVIWPAYRTI